MLEPRPNTEPPVQVQFVSVTREQLRDMDVQELSNFAWQYLGIVLDPTLGKTKMVSKLLGMAAHFR